MELLGFLVLVSVICVQGQAPDPCNDYTLLDEPRRNVKLPFDKTGNLLCDRLLRAKWYRFKDADIPFGTCITPYQCGTHVPIWLNGTIPSASDGIVSRTACGTTRPDGSGGCCQIKTPMYVKNCEQYLVYYLQPTGACSMAYCTDEQLTCGKGQYSSTGFRPCTDGYPQLTDKPHLSNPIIVGNEYMFTCDIRYPINKMDATFEVTWLLDGQPIAGVPTVTLSGSQRVAELHSNKLAGNLNKDLTCAVTTSYTDGRAGGVVSQPVSSNKYWTGIKLTTDSVDVSENRPTQEVSVISTVPVVCANQGRTDCSVDFQFALNTGMLSIDPCKVKLTPTSWNQMTLTAVTTFNITTSPSLVPFKETTQVIVSVSENGTGNMCFGMKLPPIQVHQTSSRPSAQCISTGDPHIKTFDQKSKRYNNYLIGQYTMVQRRHSSFRVEARTWKCGRVSCNCAVAMREGNDVITVDMCNGEYGKAVAKLQIQNPTMFTNSTSIVKDPSGNSYMIAFASGANVKVNVRRGKLLDLYITVPGTFHSDTEGLCGYFDGDIRNELTRKDGSVDAFASQPNPFILSWKIPMGESLFEKAELLPVQPNNFRQQNCPTNTKPTPTLNLCPACVPVSHTDLIKPSVPPSVSPTTMNSQGNTPTSGITVGPGSSHMPLSTASPGNTPSTGVNPTTGPDLTPVVSKENATQRCKAVMEKHSFTTQCTTGGFSVDYTSVLNMCVEDIQMTNDNEMALSALTSLLEQCGHELLVSHSTVSNGTVTPPSLATTCLGACSGNGVCLAGRCSCDAGFMSSDCSVDTRKPPVITNVLGNICDIATEDCFNPVVVGENILNSVNSKCYVSEAEDDPTLRTFTLPKETTILFMSTSNVKCPIQKPNTDKAVGLYSISLVNNKNVGTSNEVTYLYYNSKCQTCNDQFVCQTKPGTCKIQNVCYMMGDKDVDTNQGTCNPDVDQTSWTPDVTTPSPTTSSSTSKTSPSTSSPRPSETPTPTPSETPSPTPSETPSPSPSETPSPSPSETPSPSPSETPSPTPSPTPGADKTTTGSGNGGTGNSNILTLAPIFPNFGDLNYTASSTGCGCDFDPTLTDCACCQNFGCPCPKEKKHFCYDCFDPSTCGN